MLKYSLTIKLLTEYHLEFVSLKRDSTGSSDGLMGGGGGGGGGG